MTRLICASLLLAAALARGADVITATVAVTNSAGTTNGQTIALTNSLNSNLRTWTNSVAVPGSQILTNATAAGALTNLFGQISANPYIGVTMRYASSTSLALRAFPGDSLAVTLSAGWGTVAYSTQTVAIPTVAVPVPYTAAGAAQQTNIASGLSYWLNLSANTQQLAAAAAAMQQLSPRSNGVIWLPFLVSPSLTNGANYGDAFRSPGAGVYSEQYGDGAQALNDQAVAIGRNSLAEYENSIAIGYLAKAGSGVGAVSIGPGAVSTNDTSLAVGADSSAVGTGASAVGGTAVVAADYGTAVGNGASVAHSNSTAVGYLAASTRANQTVLGSGTVEVLVSGGLTVEGAITNVLFSGTNQFRQGSDVAFSRYAVTSLANGNNAAVPVGTNVLIQVSGPSGAFSVCGINGSPNRDGKWVKLMNRTGQTMTIANESGADPTAGNRIQTGLAADLAITNNPGVVTLFYDANASRWVVESCNRQF